VARLAHTTSDGSSQRVIAQGAGKQANGTACYA
jgi:hypothetical protein